MMKMFFRLMAVLAMAAMPGILSAKVVEVTGESSYYDDGHHSRVECERIAAEQARVDALAREFGTIITQDIVQTDRVSRGRETNDLLALSATEVRGEWLGDTNPPVFEYSYGKDNNLIVTCRVKGKAQAISNEATSFETSALRNGFFSSNASSSFRDGDQMYLYFLGSTDGYVSVFLEDESRNVYTLLPYPSDSKSEVKVKKYQEYVFFSPEKGKGQFGPEEELIMTAPDNLEYNRLYVVFSPDRYSPPPMIRREMLPEMKSADFTRWLMKARHNDPRMNVKTINLEIVPRQ